MYASPVTGHSTTCFTSKASAQRQYQQLRLAMAIHAASIVLARMGDGAKPKPPETFKPAAFLEWVREQQLRHRRRRKKESNSGRRAAETTKPPFRK